jgi:hypothetical protein
MLERYLSGVGPHGITLGQDLQRSPFKMLSYLPVGDAAAADLSKFIGSKKYLPRLRYFDGEKLRQSNRNSVENSLERPDGRIQ